MEVAVFPGTFDPPTLGHIDVIRRAAMLFGKVYVAVPTSNAKVFSLTERQALLETSLEGIDSVEVAPFSGLLVDYAERIGANVIVRALRGSIDMSFERLLAQNNRRMTGIETLCLFSAPEFAHISSSLVRQIGKTGGRLHDLVHPAIEDLIYRRLCSVQSI